MSDPVRYLRKSLIANPSIIIIIIYVYTHYGLDHYVVMALDARILSIVYYCNIEPVYYAQQFVYRP